MALTRDTSRQNFSDDKKKNDREENDWFEYEKTVLINKPMFLRGVVIAATENDLKKQKKHKDVITSTGEFTLRERRLQVWEKARSPVTSSIRKADALLSKITLFANDTVHESNTAVCNKNRRDEVFLPLILGTQSNRRGIYVYPWLSSKGDAKSFNGFETFVTAGCLFGTGLRGVNQLKRNFPFIKHEIQFLPTEKIMEIFCDPATNLYEASLFFELEQLKHAINKFSTSKKPKKLIYHLPYYDYMLFGVELFTRGRITHDALADFFKVIYSKKNEYGIKIKDIFSSDDSDKIEVDIRSPFENLFGLIENEENLLEHVLNVLDLESNEIDLETIEENQKKESEKKLVKLCIKKLSSNIFFEDQRILWEKFTKNKNDINTIEDLFKLANAIMIALASRGKENNTTCSFLPITEKQIQVEYTSLAKQYPEISSVYMITFLNFLYGYTDPTSDDYSIFYYDRPFQQAKLQKLIINRGLLKYASENIFLFSQTRQCKSLHTQLKNEKQLVEPFELDSVLQLRK